VGVTDGSVCDRSLVGEAENHAPLRAVWTSHHRGVTSARRSRHTTAFRTRTTRESGNTSDASVRTSWVAKVFRGKSRPDRIHGCRNNNNNNNKKNCNNRYSNDFF